MWIEDKGIGSCNLNLIYRRSRDGFTSKAFHSKCEYSKFPTISFIKSDKNKIFGGYTEQTWEGNGVYKNDRKAFLFSFSNNEKYPIKPSQSAFYAISSNSVTYGSGYDIYISDNCNTNSTSYANFAHSSITEDSKIYLAGAYNFKVIEIEIFTINWI